MCRRFTLWSWKFISRVEDTIACWSLPVGVWQCFEMSMFRRLISVNKIDQLQRYKQFAGCTFGNYWIAFVHIVFLAIHARDDSSWKQWTHMIWMIWIIIDLLFVILRIEECLRRRPMMIAPGKFALYRADASPTLVIWGHDFDFICSHNLKINYHDHWTSSESLVSFVTQSPKDHGINHPDVSARNVKLYKREGPQSECLFAIGVGHVDGYIGISP